jgi:glycosyltransferase involved in cell wall biosynthesis
MIGQKGVPATFGGIERHVEELSRRLTVSGCEVIAYCRTHYTPKDAALPGVRLVRLPSVDTKHLDAISHTMLATAHVLGQGVDVVHYHALGPSSLAFLPRLLGRKVVVTVHGLDWRREKWGPVASAFLRLCEWSATNFPHVTIVVSRSLESHFRRAGAHSLRYIPNGTVLPTPAPAGPAEEMGFAPGRYLLFVGRLVPEKGLHVLLRAHREHAPEWPLAIAGEGHFTDDYVATCRRAAGDNARFLGSVYGERLASLQQHAALVVAPSSLEGLSIALLEAMSIGRPVLASDIPENVEVVDGVGEVFRAGDSDDLGRRMRSLLGEPDRLSEMGRHARDRIATEYDWDRVADETRAVYEGLLRRST